MTAAGTTNSARGSNCLATRGQHMVNLSSPSPWTESVSFSFLSFTCKILCLFFKSYSQTLCSVTFLLHYRVSHKVCTLYSSSSPLCGGVGGESLPWRWIMTDSHLSNIKFFFSCLGKIKWTQRWRRNEWQPEPPTQTDEKKRWHFDKVNTWKNTSLQYDFHFSSPI